MTVDVPGRLKTQEHFNITATLQIICEFKEIHFKAILLHKVYFWLWAEQRRIINSVWYLIVISGILGKCIATSCLSDNIVNRTRSENSKQSFFFFFSKLLIE